MKSSQTISAQQNDYARQQELLKVRGELIAAKEELLAVKEELLASKERWITATEDKINLRKEKEELQGKLDQSFIDLQSNHSASFLELSQLVEKTQSELTTERDEKEVLRNELTTERDEKEVLRNELTKERDEKEVLQNNLTKEQAEKKELQAELAKSIEVNQYLMKQWNEMSQWYNASVQSNQKLISQVGQLQSQLSASESVIQTPSVTGFSVLAPKLIKNDATNSSAQAQQLVVQSGIKS